MKNKNKKGFTLIELLVVIAIIGLIASIAFIAFGGVTKKARDTKRKAELSQIGRFIQASSCYVPDGGPGEYDLADLINELKAKYPQYSNFINQAPKDPKTGNDAATNYKYIFSVDSKCALIANLENAEEPVTLLGINTPTAGGGTGVLKALTPGWNGSDKYYQIAK